MLTAVLCSNRRQGLTTHVFVGVISCTGIQPCIRISFPTNPGYRLIAHKEDPLLLAISQTPLQPGLLSLSSVQQLFSSFGWDEDLAVATVLLPGLLKEVKPVWARYITLCAVNNNGLSAVGESKSLAELVEDAVVLPVTPWRQLPAAVAAVQAEDTSLIQQLSSGSSSSSRDEWCSSVWAAGKHAIVDILAPAAIHAKASVKVTTVGDQLTVVVTEPESLAAAPGRGQGHMSTAAAATSSGRGVPLQRGTYTVQLPAGVAKGSRLHTKMSRGLGLLSVQVSSAG